MTSTPAELKQLLADRDWRMNNLYRITDKAGQVVPFRMNESQARFWEAMWWLNVILKDRQRGFSTLIAMFILDSCLWTPHTQAGIIDITLPDAKKKLAKILFAYDGLPESIKAAVPLVTDAKETLEWANGSRVDVSTSHRGGTLQILHVSEYGKISARKPEVAREIRTGAFNTVGCGPSRGSGRGATAAVPTTWSARQPARRPAMRCAGATCWRCRWMARSTTSTSTTGCS